MTIDLVYCLFILGNPSKKKDTATRLVKNLPFLRQPPSDFPPSFIFYDVVFIIDDSGSISRGQFNKGLSAIRLLIKEATNLANFAAIKFSDKATLLFNFVSSSQAMRKLSNVAHNAGMTNTQDALKMARNLFQNSAASGLRNGAEKFAVVVTDGNSNVEEDQTVLQARQLKRTGTRVIVIAVGSYGNAGLKEMKDIASKPSDKNVYVVDDFDALQQVVRMAISYLRDSKT